MRTGHIATIVSFLVVGAAVPRALGEPFTNSSSVLDGCGGWASNGTFRTIIAAAQPCPVGVNAGGGFVNYSGFLNTFLLRPNLDTDGDGIADENDPDNDNDTLTDAEELAGTPFSPTTPTDTQVADSDGDGCPDGGEAVAGTNPWDDNSLLAITEILRQGNDVVVVWKSRGGYTYQLLASTNLPAWATTTQLVATVTAAGGVAPWYETSSRATNAAPPEARFYRVRREK